MRSFVFLLSLLFFAPAFAVGIPIFYDPSVGTPSVTTIDDASIKIVGQQRCVGGRSAKKVTLYGTLDFEAVGVPGLVNPAVKKQSGTQVAPWQVLTAGQYTMRFDATSTAQKSNKKWTITQFVGADQAGSKIKGTVRYNYKNSSVLSNKPPKYAVSPLVPQLYLVLRIADTYTDLSGNVTLINGNCTLNGTFKTNPS